MNSLRRVVKKGDATMKKYRLSHLSYDFLAWNRELVTNTARYIFQQEVWEEGRRYIIAKREPFGSPLGETVKVVIRV